MDQPDLPRHIVERVERRWAAVLSHQATLRPAWDRAGTATADCEAGSKPGPASSSRGANPRRRLMHEP